MIQPRSARRRRASQLDRVAAVGAYIVGSIEGAGVSEARHGGGASIGTCDLTKRYVEINEDYRS